MAIKRFSETEAVNEQTDGAYVTTFLEVVTDPSSQINAAAIQTLVATLTDFETGAVINGRDEQDVKNANDGTLTDEGEFTLRLGTLDHVIVGEPPTAYTYDNGWKRLAPGLEEHRLVLRVTYTRTDGNVGTLNHEVRFFVMQIEGVE